MKKLISLLCTAVMVLGLSSSVLANGSILDVAPSVSGKTALGEVMETLKETPNGVSEEYKAAEEKWKSDPVAAAEDTRAAVKEQGVKKADGTLLDLTGFEPFSAPSIIGVDGDADATEVVEEEVAINTDFDMTGKNLEDIEVIGQNPFTNEYCSVETGINEDEESKPTLSLTLTFHPNSIQIWTK